MPPKRKPAPLNESWGTPIGNVAFVTGEGQYDTANKRFRFNAIFFDLQRNPVLVPGRSRDDRLRINIPESDASDPAKVTSIVRRFVEGAFRLPVETAQGGAAGPSPAEPPPADSTPQEMRAVREDRFTTSWYIPPLALCPLPPGRASPLPLPLFRHVPGCFAAGGGGGGCSCLPVPGKWAVAPHGIFPRAKCLHTLPHPPRPFFSASSSAAFLEQPPS